MATYDFETITSQTATSLQPTDQVRIATGTAAQTALLYDSGNNISITVGTRTVVFGFVPAGGLAGKRFLFPDGSATFAGDLLDNNISLVPTVGAPPGAGYGGSGADTFTATGGSWYVQGNQGSDRITVAFGSNTVYGGQDHDTISFGGAGGQGNNFTNGNKGDDTITGSAGIDTLLGGQGNDVMDGVRGSADFINGNLGNDTISGGGQLFGEGGDDVITVSPYQASTVRGGDGNDRVVVRIAIEGNQHFSPVVAAFGEDGNDFLDSDNLAIETLSGGAGDDTIYSFGNESGDLLDGGDGNDRMFARGASNTLLGGAGNDLMEGGEGAETFDGGAGFDTLAGGFGADLFIEDDGLGVQFVISTTLNRITHWENSDHIQLRGKITAQQYVETQAENLFTAQTVAETALQGGAEVVAIQIGADVVIYTDVSAGSSIHNAIMLAGRSLADISVDNFV